MSKVISKKKHLKISQVADAQGRLFEDKPRPVAKGKKKKLPKVNPRELRKRGWMVCGFDTSMSSLAAAAIGYDFTLKKLRGPVFAEVRWHKDDHYYDRIATAAKSHELVLDLMHKLGLELNLNEVWVAQEEPWPFGMVGRGKGQSAFLKQQAEISGAFLGGLLRYGYNQLSQINSIRWRTMIAEDFGITTHHSKWQSPKLAAEYNCKPKDSGKFRSKEWALGAFPDSFAAAAGFPEEIPDWPDIIESAQGKVPRPEKSVAKAVQPDDRYDALAIMWTHYQELLDEGALEDDPS